MSGLKRTPLFDQYLECGAKTIDFGGWELPVQFSSIKAEHEAVRTKAGLFDVSHMGEIEVTGDDAEAVLQSLMTNDVSVMKEGDALYTAMCYENGGTIDDLIIYKHSPVHYLLVVNAANSSKDFEWITSHAANEVSVVNRSNEIAQLAIQGPLAESILQKIATHDLSQIGFFEFEDHVLVNGIDCLVSRTGYTGEDGFEIYCSSSDAPKLWKILLETGKEEGLVPCGLGARDTLRFEAKLPLYGQELTKDITPIEAGIGFAVKVNKENDFIGKAVLAAQKKNGAPRKLVGIEMIDKGIPRAHYAVFAGETQIGEITTGTQSPTLKKSLGLALIDKHYSELGTEVAVDIRGTRRKAIVVKSPFYRRQK